MFGMGGAASICNSTDQVANTTMETNSEAKNSEIEVVASSEVVPAHPVSLEGNAAENMQVPAADAARQLPPVVSNNPPDSPSVAAPSILGRIPSKLSKVGQSAELVGDNEMTLKSLQKDARYGSACVAQADHPVPTRWCGFTVGQVYYFEMEVVSEADCPMIGLTDATYDLDHHPGWDETSYAYHGDDGSIFRHVNGKNDYSVKGPKFLSVGDVVGIGVRTQRNQLFFTHNGECVYTMEKVDLKLPLYPSFGVKRAGDEVKCNLGQHPFKYDLEKELSVEKIAHGLYSQLGGESWQLDGGRDGFVWYNPSEVASELVFLCDKKHHYGHNDRQNSSLKKQKGNKGSGQSGDVDLEPDIPIDGQEFQDILGDLISYKSLVNITKMPSRALEDKLLVGDLSFAAKIQGKNAQLSVIQLAITEGTKDIVVIIRSKLSNPERKDYEQPFMISDEFYRNRVITQLQALLLALDQWIEYNIEIKDPVQLDILKRATEPVSNTSYNYRTQGQEEEEEKDATGDEKLAKEKLKKENLKTAKEFFKPIMKNIQNDDFTDIQNSLLSVMDLKTFSSWFGIVGEQPHNSFVVRVGTLDECNANLKGKSSGEGKEANRNKNQMGQKQAIKGLLGPATIKDPLKMFIRTIHINENKDDKKGEGQKGSEKEKKEALFDTEGVRDKSKEKVFEMHVRKGKLALKPEQKFVPSKLEPDIRAGYFVLKEMHVATSYKGIEILSSEDHLLNSKASGYYCLNAKHYLLANVFMQRCGWIHRLLFTRKMMQSAKFPPNRQDVCDALKEIPLSRPTARLLMRWFLLELFLVKFGISRDAEAPNGQSEGLVDLDTATLNNLNRMAYYVEGNPDFPLIAVPGIEHPCLNTGDGSWMKTLMEPSREKSEKSKHGAILVRQSIVLQLSVLNMLCRDIKRHHMRNQTASGNDLHRMQATVFQKEWWHENSENFFRLMMQTYCKHILITSVCGRPAFTSGVRTFTPSSTNKGIMGLKEHLSKEQQKKLKSLAIGIQEKTMRRRKTVYETTGGNEISGDSAGNVGEESVPKRSPPLLDYLRWQRNSQDVAKEFTTSAQTYRLGGVMSIPVSEKWKLLVVDSCRKLRTGGEFETMQLPELPLGNQVKESLLAQVVEKLEESKIPHIQELKNLNLHKNIYDQEDPRWYREGTLERIKKEIADNITEVENQVNGLEQKIRDHQMYVETYNDHTYQRWAKWKLVELTKAQVEHLMENLGYLREGSGEQASKSSLLNVKEAMDILSMFKGITVDTLKNQMCTQMLPYGWDEIESEDELTPAAQAKFIECQQMLVDADMDESIRIGDFLCLRTPKSLEFGPEKGFEELEKFGPSETLQFQICRLECHIVMYSAPTDQWCALDQNNNRPMPLLYETKQYHNTQASLMAASKSFAVSEDGTIQDSAIDSQMPKMENPVPECDLIERVSQKRVPVGIINIVHRPASQLKQVDALSHRWRAFRTLELIVLSHKNSYDYSKSAHMFEDKFARASKKSTKEEKNKDFDLFKNTKTIWENPNTETRTGFLPWDSDQLEDFSRWMKDDMKFNVSRNGPAWRALGGNDLWIDAICLDQKNILEKKYGVQNMAWYYRMFSRVIIVPGKPATIPRFLHTLSEIQVALDTAVAKCEVKMENIEDLAESIRFLGSMGDDFAERAWTFQEIVMANELVSADKDVDNLLTLASSKKKDADEVQKVLESLRKDLNEQIRPVINWYERDSSTKPLSYVLDMGEALLVRLISRHQLEEAKNDRTKCLELCLAAINNSKATMPEDRVLAIVPSFGLPLSEGNNPKERASNTLQLLVESWRLERETIFYGACGQEQYKCGDMFLGPIGNLDVREMTKRHQISILDLSVVSLTMREAVDIILELRKDIAKVDQNLRIVMDTLLKDSLHAAKFDEMYAAYEKERDVTLLMVWDKVWYHACVAITGNIENKTFSQEFVSMRVFVAGRENVMRGVIPRHSTRDALLLEDTKELISKRVQ